MAADSLNIWLQNPEHLQDSAAYFGKLYPYYTAKLQVGDYDAAAQALISCGKALDRLYSIDKGFLTRLLTFIAEHETQVSAVRANELNYYAGVEYLAIPYPDSTLYFMHKIKSVDDDFESRKIAGMAKSMRAFSYLAIKRLDSANVDALAALTIFESLHDTTNIAKTYKYLYLINSNMNAYNQAENYLNKSLEWTILGRDTIGIAGTYNSKFLFYMQTGDTLQAIDNGRAAMRLLQQNRQQLSKSENFDRYNVYARTLMAQGKYGEASLYIDSCRQLLDGYESLAIQRAYLTTRAWYELKTKGRITDPQSLLQLADRFKKLKSFRLLNEIYSVLTEDAANRNDFAGAYRYKIQQITYRDSLWNNDLRGRISELSVQYETQKKAQQITFLQKEKKLAIQRNWWIGSSVLILMILCIYLVRLQGARRRLQLEAKKDQAEASAKLLQQELEIKQIEIAAHRNLLEDYSRLLIGRNEQRSDLPRRISHEKDQAGAPSNKDSENLYNQVILTDMDWEKFQGYFEKVYPGFIAQLRTRRPELTPAEMRLVLLDSMGLSLKEVAAILGIGLEAVKKGRYRLKKKYNLNSSDLKEI